MDLPTQPSQYPVTQTSHPVTTNQSPEFPALTSQSRMISFSTVQWGNVQAPAAKLSEIPARCHGEAGRAGLAGVPKIVKNVRKQFVGLIFWGRKGCHGGHHEDCVGGRAEARNGPLGARRGPNGAQMAGPWNIAFTAHLFSTAQ